MSRGEKKAAALGIVAALLLVAGMVWLKLSSCRWSCEALEASYVKTTVAACICERGGQRFVGGHP